MFNPIKWYASTSCLLPGYTFLVLGKYEKATLFFDMAIRFGPTIPEAYLRRGDCYYGKEEYLRAIQDYDQAIEMCPVEPLIYRARARAWSCLGDWEQSISDYDHAVSLNEKDASSHFERGSAYISVGNFTNALKDFEKAVELEPKNAEFNAAIGHAHWCLGSPDIAADMYGKCSDSTKANATFYLLLRCVALREAGKEEDALETLAGISKAIGQKEWTQSFVSYLLGVVSTEAFLESMVAEEPPIRDMSRFFAASLLSLNGNVDEAIKHFRWIETHGDKRVVVNSLASARLARLTSESS